VTTLEILPTLARLAGARLPGDRRLDGFEISDLLLGANGAHSRRTTLYSLYGYAANRKESMREGQWKLHLSGVPELYDLSKDLPEAHSGAAEHEDVVKRLNSLAAGIRDETHAISNSTATTAK
jgi:arylsulfatase